MILSNKIIKYSNLNSINNSTFEIKHIRPPDNLCEYCITLITRREEFEDLFNNSPKNILAIIPEGLETLARKYNPTFLISDNPRLTFSLIINHFFNLNENYKIHLKASINSNLSIHKNVSIGSQTIVDGNVSIDAGAKIGKCVIISGDVEIGKNVKIGSGTVIGHDGFNYSRDNKGTPHEFPHIGKVLIGDGVSIGANCTIARGSLSDTFINNDVKIDDQVHIAHNVNIDKNVLIAAGAVISGSVIIGNNVWIGPNASLIDHINIGNNSKIGVGALVMKNIPENATVAGNPGRVLLLEKQR
jgi:UDP-3-O-[3-hydroxymyristoyl] glucosamine N-acyltransferase